ncbi:hypothetical protein ACPF8X_23880 [Streptomyces sp. G35A]
MWIASGSGVREVTLDAADFELSRATADGLRGGDARYNAAAVHRVLGGKRSAARDAVLANATGALAAHRGLERAGDLHAAFAKALATARAAIDDGRATTALQQWLKLAGTLLVG